MSAHPGFPIPPIARAHCRHYSYENRASAGSPFGGPKCKIGCDLSAPGASMACMPEPKQACDKREEWSEEERQRTIDFRNERVARMLTIFAALPERVKGSSGTIKCPACGSGTVAYSISSYNGHRHAACSTPGCFQVME